MDFSKVFPNTGSSNCCKWSPNGLYLANVAQQKLAVRAIGTLQIVAVFPLAADVDYVEWSPDSHLLMTVCRKKSLVQVWSIDNVDWRCKIEEGLMGLCHAIWAPDSLHILTVSEFKICTTVWSLATKGVTYLRVQPKSVDAKRLSFSHNGKFLALMERRQHKDFISIFSADTWERLIEFQTESRNLVGLSWSHDDSMLCAWDTALSYKLFVYTASGQLLSSYSAYSDALGIKSVEWSPRGDLLAVGSYDQKLRILSPLTGKLLSEHLHTATVDAQSVPVFREAELAVRLPNNPRAQSVVRSKYEIAESSVALPCNKPPPDRPNPEMGVGTIAWSCDGTFLATINDNMPHACFLWEVSDLKQQLYTVLWQQRPISSVRWDPSQPRLALCTGGGKIFLWSEGGASCCDIPSEKFHAHSLEWNPDGQSLLLLDKDKITCCSYVGPQVAK